MSTCFVLSELSQREKEKIMLLLAAADESAWHAVRDDWNNLYIEWRVNSTHPALSIPPLTPADVKQPPPPPPQQQQQQQKEEKQKQKQQNEQQRWDGSAATREHRGTSPLGRWVTRTHGMSPSLRKSLSFNSGPNADSSPWTIDWNTDSVVTAEQFYTANTSHPFASDDSHKPHKSQIQKQQQQQQQRVRNRAMSSMSARGRRGSSQHVRGGTPFLNGQSVFLRRCSTPRQSSVSLPTSVERSFSRRNSNNVTSSLVSNVDNAFSHSTTTRSAQWVSRLVEDIMSYVAKLVTIDNSQVRSVAALTVTVLKARYGAFQWNKMLKELAYGLHLYHSICPLCRLFRELFVDESSSALEDLSLFARLHRSALKYSTVEVQKVILPHSMKNGENGEDDTSHSVLQYTIASRRYVELHLLTRVLTEMLAAVSIIDSRNIGKKCSMGNRRKLKPAEVVGVKAIVAYWVEEESCNCDSLAFDLGGYVDLHEVIAVVVSALRSSHNPNTTENPNAMMMIKPTRDKDTLQGKIEKPKLQNEDRGSEEAITSVAHARSIVQSQGRVPEGTVQFLGKSKHLQTASPSVVSKSVQFSSNHSEKSTRKNEATDSSNIRILLRGVSEEEYDEPYQRAQESVNQTISKEQNLKVSKRDNPLRETTVRECTPLTNGGKSSALDSRREVAAPTEVYTAPQQTSGAPLVVDLDPKSLEGCEQPSSYHSLPSRQSTTQDVETQKYGTETQPQQYFAALAAIDAELQRRREFLTSTVAIDLTTRGMVSDTSKGFDEQTSAAKRSTHSPERLQMQQDSTYTAVAAELAKPIESTAPPANAGTFYNVNNPPMMLQRPPNSILMPSKYQTQVKPVGRHGEEEEGLPMPSDLEMLTDDERNLLADLRQALSHQT
ncbi:putative glucosamine-6-phosphate isomerase, putative,glucosamine-6-phosphate deaminase [Trypanosoma theileri]|uniref:Putative glucosamine-6-phosphate isomerase, putative,glucosamine-6-phosphate deaminase n=1 Tax=Trypanosoma theileri TaxID=67003 RepID=A0A1X0P4I1_9TRYP|nr:putative glucosamine-6-phosphate isomerase, putative,glucosamine-6-phosphate deaminase [Trypanosoma theileri]ORC91785.1 putative glucosamine-6-phosphate isomerase, putative,glucosamine-6-phosphate deaminase [Trypanosoma theileri]